MPQISVIIPSYNRANLLKDAILSVLNQTYQNFELIIVNDCSKDNTKNIVKTFRDQRVIYLENEKNKGVSASSNIGIKKARGEYIFILNDDDLIVPWGLEELIKKIKQSDLENLGGIYGWSWWVYNEGKTLKVLDSQEKGNIFKAILKDQVFTNILLKKEVFNNIGFYNETLFSSEDYDFYLRLAKVYKIDFVPKILFVIRVQQQKHLSQLSFSHLKRYQSVKQCYSQDARNHRILMLKFFPITFYLKLSLLKHKIATILKIMGNTGLRQEIAEIREELRRQGTKI